MCHRFKAGVSPGSSLEASVLGSSFCAVGPPAPRRGPGCGRCMGLVVGRVLACFTSRQGDQLWRQIEIQDGSTGASARGTRVLAPKLVTFVPGAIRVAGKHKHTPTSSDLEKGS